MTGPDEDPGTPELELAAWGNVTLSIEYTAGSEGIQAGGVLRMNFHRRGSIRCGLLQVTDPQSDNYVAASTNGQATLQLGARNSGATRELKFTVLDAPLVEGEKIFITIGDTSGGGAGWRVGTSAGAPVPPYMPEPAAWNPWWCLVRTFRFSVVVAGGGLFENLESPDLPFTIYHGAVTRVSVFAPSQATVEGPFHIVIRVEDQFGNTDESFDGAIDLSCTDPAAALPSVVTLTPVDKGFVRIDGVMLSTPGIHSIHAQVSGRSIETDSNPIECLVDSAGPLLLWGDIHCHTRASDGADSHDGCYAYAREISRLDFASATDHTGSAWQYSEWMGDIARTKAIEYDVPGEFAALYAYEHSFPEGHRNVYYRSTVGDVFPTETVRTPNPGSMLEALAGQDAIAIPHHVAQSTHGPVNWSYHDPKLQRLAEVYSNHGLCEYQGNPKPPWPGIQVEGKNVQDALALGYKLGIIAASDTHITRPGLLTPYDILPARNGLGAVYAKSLTREDVWDALFGRYCYGTTGERIILDFKINGYVMGSEIPLRPDIHPQIYAKVIGTSILTSVEVVKGCIASETPFPVVHEINPGVDTCEFTWTDPAPSSDCFYYIRVTQIDSEMAWSSPIWVSPTMRIRNITRDKSTGDVTVRWGCLPYRLYSVYYKDNFDDEWQLAQTDIPSSDSGVIEWTDDGTLTGSHPSNVSQRLYTIRADG